MVVVFDLSKPISFYPLYHSPIPIELFDEFGSSILLRNVEEIKKLNLPLELIVVENIIKQNIEYPYPVREVIFINEELPIFEKIFLMTSFMTSARKETKVLFIRGNMVLNVNNSEKITKIVQKINSNDFLYSLPLIIFSFKNTFRNLFLELSETEENFERINIFSVKGIYKIPEGEQKIKESLKNFSEMFYFNTLRLKDIFCSEKEMGEVFLNCEELWSKEVFFLDDWISNLNSIKNLKIKERLISEGIFCIELETEVKNIEKIPDLFEVYPPDENRNLLKGKINYSNIKNSIIINESSSLIEISNLSNILILAKGNTQYISHI